MAIWPSPALSSYAFCYIFLILLITWSSWLICLNFYCIFNFSCFFVKIQVTATISIKRSNIWFIFHQIYTALIFGTKAISLAAFRSVYPLFILFFRMMLFYTLTNSTSPKEYGIFLYFTFVSIILKFYNFYSEWLSFWHLGISFCPRRNFWHTFYYIIPARLSLLGLPMCNVLVNYLLILTKVPNLTKSFRGRYTCCLP